jgi:MFS family permease
MKWSKLINTTSVPVSIMLLILNITYGGIISFIALYGKEIGIPNPGIFFLVYAAGIALTRFFAGKIFDNYGPRLLMISGTLVLALGFPILALVKNNFGFLLSAWLMGMGGGVLMPALQSMVNNMVSHRNRGAANSTLFTALDLGIGIGMVLIGFISEHFGLTVSFLSCTGIVLAAFVYYIVYVEKHYLQRKIYLIH